MAQINVPIKIDGLGFVIGLMKKLVEEADFKEDVSDDYKKGFYDFSNAVITALEQLKDEDVELVRHGRWVIIEILCGGGKERKYYRCSECNKANVIRSNYCPNCGARMDGDADANGNDNKTPET